MIGFLLGNGVPHFVYGAAGTVFRNPFGKRSKPKTNMLWGLSNFIAANLITGALSAIGLFDKFSLIPLLLGFWSMMLVFGTRIKTFLNEPALQTNLQSS